MLRMACQTNPSLNKHSRRLRKTSQNAVNEMRALIWQQASWT